LLPDLTLHTETNDITANLKNIRSRPLVFFLNPVNVAVRSLRSPRSRKKKKKRIETLPLPLCICRKMKNKTPALFLSKSKHMLYLKHMPE